MHLFKFYIIYLLISKSTVNSVVSFFKIIMVFDWANSININDFIMYEVENWIAIHIYIFFSLGFFLFM